MRYALLSCVLFYCMDAYGDDNRARTTSEVKLQLRGRIAASEVVHVRPRVSGQLVKILAIEGSKVRKGDLIAELDSRQYAVAVNLARANLRKSQIKLKLANVEMLKAQQMQQAGKGNHLDEAEANLEFAKLDIAASEANLSLAELDLDSTRVTSPIDGYLGRFRVSVGDLWRADHIQGDPVVVIVRTDPVFVEFDIDEESFLLLTRLGKLENIGVHFGLDDEANLPRKGQIHFVDPVVTPGRDANSKGTVQIRATSPNPDGLLRPGMSVAVRLELPR